MLRTAAALALLVGLAAPSADAATVVLDGDTATGILDVEVTGFALPFNVDFVSGEALDVYAAGFFGVDTEAEAEAATDAIVAALNADGNATGVGPSDDFSFLLGYEFFSDASGENVVQTVALFSAFDGEWFLSATDSEGAANVPATFAALTPVPVPAALPLLGSAVAGLALWRRARRAPAG